MTKKHFTKFNNHAGYTLIKLRITFNLYNLIKKASTKILLLTSYMYEKLNAFPQDQK